MVRYLGASSTRRAHGARSTRTSRVSTSAISFALWRKDMSNCMKCDCMEGVGVRSRLRHVNSPNTGAVWDSKPPSRSSALAWPPSAHCPTRPMQLEPPTPLCSKPRSVSPVLLDCQGGQQDHSFQVVQPVPLRQRRQAHPWDQALRAPRAPLELLPGPWDQGHLRHPVLTVTSNSDCTQQCTRMHTHTPYAC